MQSDPSKQSPVRVLEKAIAILDELQKDERQRGRLNKIAKGLKLPKATAFRILKTLEKSGYVDYDETCEEYSLSEKARHLGYPNITSLLIRQARPIMTRLLAEFEQTVNLAAVESDRLVYKVAQQGIRSIRCMNAIPGALLSWKQTALGRSILAYLPEAEVVAKVRVNSGNKLSERDLERFLQELKRIRSDGFALDIEESEEGLCCVSAAVFNGSDRPFAALSISGSSGALKPDVLPVVGRRVVEECRTLSATLGALDPPYPSLLQKFSPSNRGAHARLSVYSSGE